MTRFLAALLPLAVGGCYSGLEVDAQDLPPGAGDGTDPSDDPDSGGSGSDSGEPGSDTDPESQAHFVQIGLRRLSAQEYDQSVAYLLGDTVRSSADLLPQEEPDPEEDYPFETHFESQLVSNALITAAETLAQENIEALLADPARRDAVVGCAPEGPQDDVCMRSFVADFGRRAFRRPLSEDEVERYLELQTCTAGADDDCGFASDTDDFYEGVAAVIGSMLVSPRFLFRVEEGTPVPDRPGAFRLDGYEVASRLSFLLWGTTPDDDLLDMAEDGSLDDAEGVRATAAWMLEDPRARAQVARFHATWLGYLDLRHDEATVAAMRRESDALVERVIFEEQRPWAELFTFPETFVDDALATAYGIPSPGDQPGWVELPPSSGRAGVLSHGSFLSVDALANGDTRPIARGLRVSTILMCQPIPPPPADISLDEPKDAGECKADIVRAHAQGTCIGCHQYMDGLGMGLEAYDGLGRPRDYETDNPDCAIDDEGMFPATADSPAGTFSGPAELGKMMTETEQLQACAATQLMRFAVGRTIRRKGVKQGIHEEDVPLVDTMIDTLGKDGRFDELVLELVSSPFFLHRVEY